MDKFLHVLTSFFGSCTFSTGWLARFRRLRLTGPASEAGFGLRYAGAPHHGKICSSVGQQFCGMVRPGGAKLPRFCSAFDHILETHSLEGENGFHPTDFNKIGADARSHVQDHLVLPWLLEPSSLIA